MKFDNYNHFKNYCLKVASNKEYIVSDYYLKVFEKFEIVVSLLEKLQDNKIIKLHNDILDILCNHFKKGEFETVFSNMKCLINVVRKFKNKEKDFYYVITSLNRVIGLDVEFEESFILNHESKLSPFYPSKVLVLETGEDESEIYVVNKLDIDYKNKYGIYFIYNNENKLVYIGKSTSCLLTRAFQSAKERETLDFSKIELRECKSKSDVAIYEAYYISLYKPIHNKDLIFEDVPSIILPELNVSKEIVRDLDKDYFKYKYTYLKSGFMNTEEFITLYEQDNTILDTIENKKIFKDKGIYSKSEMKQRAYIDAMQQVKLSGKYMPTSDIS